MCKNLKPGFITVSADRDIKSICQIVQPLIIRHWSLIASCSSPELKLAFSLFPVTAILNRKLCDVLKSRDQT